MVLVEKSFPRGGTVKSTTEPKEKVDFGAVQFKKKSESKKKQTEDEVSDNEEQEEIADENPIEAISAELLNYQTIQEGMVILGTVKSVEPVCAKIALPGRMVAKVLASSVSESYNKILQEFVRSADRVENYKPLNSLYEIGQTVYGKVMEIKENEDGRTELNLSLKPADVHSELNHTNVRKGMIFNGAIEEIQEHGYIIETGIQNLRCFLPLDKSQQGHSIGQLVFMKIEKLTQSSAASTAICKEVTGENRKIKDQIDPHLDYLLPSTIVNFSVTKVLKDGLQGTIMNGAFTGYINEHQLAEPLALPDDYEVNSTLSAKILYTMPLTKLVYLSLNLNPVVETEFHRGDIIEKAKVHHMGTGGVVLILNNTFKGVISLKTIKANFKGNYDQDEIFTKYCKGSKHKVRILDYDPVDSLYICTDDARILNEKIFTLDDLLPGEFVNAKVEGRDQKTGGYHVTVGNVRGIIEKLFLASSSKNLQEKSQIRCRVLATNNEGKIVYLTNRSEYMAKNAKLLTSLLEAKEHRTFLGTIVKCGERFFIVKFFNNLKGILYKEKISGIIQNELSTFYEGQTMSFRILGRTDDKIIIGLAEDNYKMGEICPARITHILPTGLEIDIDEDEGCSFKAVIPIRLVSDYLDLVSLKLQTFKIGEMVKACCIVKNIFSLREVPYFNQEPTKTWKSIQAGDILRGFIKNVEGDIVEVLLPIQGYDKLVKVHLKMFLTEAIRNPNIVVTPDQVVYVKILSKDTVSKALTVSAKLTDIWDGNLKSTGEYFANYLDELYSVQKKLNSHLGAFRIGDKVKAKLIGRNDETGDWYLELPNEVQGVIKSSFLKKTKKFQSGTTYDCVVLWIDYLTQVVYISNSPNEIDRISNETQIPDNFVNKVGINGKVLLKLDNVIVCSLKKGFHPIVFLPTRLHFNDFESTMASDINEGDFVRLAFIHEKYPIAVLESTWKLWHSIQQQNKRKSETNDEEHSQPPMKKRKFSVLLRKDSIPLIYEDKVGRHPIHNTRTVEEPSEDVEMDSGSDSGDSEDSEYHFKPKSAAKPDRKTKTDTVTPVLPGASGFWTADLNPTQHVDDSSSEDEGDDEDDAKKLKKKTSAADRFRQAKEEEARLREIEEKYANPNILPETIDQFDRLVIADPNNSKNWINYMVHHLQATEIDKARAVARRALKTISFREEAEIVNIWVALLNLELRYGTDESFKDLMREALQCNDPKKIYLRVFEILAEAKKTQELSDVVNIATKKFKEEVDIWKGAADSYFVVGMVDRAKQLLSKCLAVLPDREHINVTVIFANLNHKHGDSETAHALLEQVITSYPKRVDVWSQYIDMLIKDNQIESARNTLERAVIQKIPMKKMRTLFKKFLDFEEKYGNEENVQKVKQQAANYLSKEIDG